MCFRRVSASVTSPFFVVLVIASKMRVFTHEFAAVRSTSAFSSVWHHNACVSHKCIIQEGFAFSSL